MNPIYKFSLSDGTATRQALPVYGDGLALEYALEQNQQFFRAKLSGKLTFQLADHDFIASRPIDTRFSLLVDISYDRGASWTQYWKGKFWKTDCKFDADTRTAVVTPEVDDVYSDLLAGMDKEFNLIDLAPVTQAVKLDKRPMVQVYVPGRSVIGCFLSGMWWEQECDAVEWTAVGEGWLRLLETKYGFAFNKSYTRIEISGSMSPQLPETVINIGSETSPWFFNFTSGNYRFERGQITNFDHVSIYDASTGLALWTNSRVNHSLYDTYEVNLHPVEGRATGIITLKIEQRAVFARYVTDVKALPGGTTTMPIPEDDLVPQNRNYHYVIGYQFPNTVWISERLVSTPTKWGIYQPGLYYDPGVPASAGLGEMYPVSRDAWNVVSVWFTENAFDTILERQLRKEALLKHAYPVSSAIQVLLAQIAPGITHDGTPDYSLFLYEVNPLSGITQRLLVSPKSNLVSLGYDEPAQKAPITLKNVMDMLRDCYRCYWFVDAQSRLRIEHVSYFMRGGRYSGTPAVGLNITQRFAHPGGKAWAFASNQYEYDKPELTARYEFGWMDDVTQLFEGYPIDVLSNYVNREKVDKVEVQRFTSDVDYIMLNPSSVSKDGFVLLSAQLGSGEQSFTVRTNSEYGPIPFGVGQITFHEGQRYRFTVDVPVEGQPAVIFFDMKGLNFIILSPPTYTAVVTAPITSDGAFLYNTTSIFGQVITITVEQISEDLRLPYVDNYFEETHHVLQNAWASFWFLQRYYMYDLPARQVEINGVVQVARGVRKTKTQKVKFPALQDPDLQRLVRTGLGDGQINKLTINLSSRSADATLKYETE